MQNELFILTQYGHIEINIKELMDNRGITRGYLARKLGTRFEVVDKWYNGHVEKIDADILARMCFVLGCTPADIIIYKED